MAGDGQNQGVKGTPLQGVFGTPPAQPAVQQTPPAAASDQGGGQQVTTGGGGTPPETIPYARFKEVNDRLQAYSSYDLTPEQVGEMVSLVEMIAEGMPEQPGAPAAVQPAARQDGQPTDAELSQTRDALLKVFPSLGKLDQLIQGFEGQQRQQQLSQQQQQAYRTTQARGSLKKVAIEAGYAEDVLPKLEIAVAGLIEADEEMRNRYLSNDFGVVTDAFKQYEDTLVAPRARSLAATVKGVKATNQRELAPRVAGGAPPGTAPPPRPKSIKEARGRALQFLQERGSGLIEEEGEV